MSSAHAEHIRQQRATFERTDPIDLLKQLGYDVDDEHVHVDLQDGICSITNGDLTYLHTPELLVRRRRLIRESRLNNLARAINRLTGRSLVPTSGQEPGRDEEILASFYTREDRAGRSLFTELDDKETRKLREAYYQHEPHNPSYGRSTLTLTQGPGGYARIPDVDHGYFDIFFSGSLDSTFDALRDTVTANQVLEEDQAARRPKVETVPDSSTSQTSKKGA